MVSEAKREALHRKVDLLLEQLGNGQKLRPYFYEVVDSLLEETSELQARKVDNADLREAILQLSEGFKRMDVRFEQVEKRFEQIDKRFEQIDKRFEQIDKRFEEMYKYSDKRFEDLQTYMNKRFEQVDKRFEQVDKRFEQVDLRFNRLYQFLMWMMGLIATGFLGLYLKLFFLRG